MAITILGVLAKIVSGLGIAEGDLIAALTSIKTQFPDVASQETTLVAWLKAHIDPNLDPAGLASTLAGLAKDIIAGSGPIDPQAWLGSV